MKKSVWETNNKLHSASKLNENTQADICIIGAGISGMYTAYLLAKKGLNVIVVEANETVGGTATLRSTGKLTAQHAVIYSTLPVHLREIYYNSNNNSIEQACSLLSIKAYEKVTSYLYAQTDEGTHQLKEEIEAYKKLPFTPISTSEIDLPINIQLAIGMPNMTQIHPAQFMKELTTLALQAGVTIHTNTRITKVVPSQKKVYSEDEFEISCKHLILCTHYPIESMRNLSTMKLQVMRSYLCAVETPELLQNHYLGIDPQIGRTARTALINGKPFFVYGGGSHIAGTEEHTSTYYETLQNELKSIYNLEKPSYFWSSQDVQTISNLPYIGALSKNDDFLYIATGFKKWGLSTSLLAGEILTSAIFHEFHPAAEMMSPKRDSFSKQLIHGFVQASFVTEEFVKGYVQRSYAPKCTHLGCKTKWNEGDKTWDCPCHGSRFDENGQVVEGPAVYPLKLSPKD